MHELFKSSGFLPNLRYPLYSSVCVSFMNIYSAPPDTETVLRDIVCPYNLQCVVVEFYIVMLLILYRNDMTGLQDTKYSWFM